MPTRTSHMPIDPNLGKFKSVTKLSTLAHGEETYSPMVNCTEHFAEVDPAFISDKGAAAVRDSYCIDPTITSVGDVESYGEYTVSLIEFVYCADDDEIEDKSSCWDDATIEEWYHEY